jgi:pSer/pThr/pTyr-binding forkhead associated (FHA) protein
MLIGRTLGIVIACTLATPLVAHGDDTQAAGDPMLEPSLVLGAVGLATLGAGIGVAVHGDSAGPELCGVSGCIERPDPNTELAGVAMVSHDFRDRTAAVARQLARQVMLADGEELRGAALVVMSGPQAGQRFEIASPPSTMSIGRADDNDIVLDDREASRHHLSLDVAVDGVIARDRGGKNSLLVNDQEVKEQRLKDRDELLVGATRLVFDEPVEAYLRELAQVPDAPIPAPQAKSGADFVDEDEVGDEASASETGSHGEAHDDDDDAREDGADDHASRESGESGDVPHDEAERSPQADVVEKAAIGRDRGLSPSAEVVVLFVGVLALAVCIFALVWIFR